MSVPKKRQNRRRKRMRASHAGLAKAEIGICPKCKKPILPHQVCKHCGFYNGKDILKLESKLNKKQKKDLEKKRKMEKKEQASGPTQLDEQGNPIK
ncbi:MAG: 50S ribosomal protein L32 [Patescibacteria group bacterium]